MRVYFLQKVGQILAAALVIYLILGTDRLCEIHHASLKSMEGCHQFLARTVFTYNVAVKTEHNDTQITNTTESVNGSTVSNPATTTEPALTEDTHVRRKRAEAKVLPTDDEIVDAHKKAAAAKVKKSIEHENTAPADAVTKPAEVEKTSPVVKSEPAVAEVTEKNEKKEQLESDSGASAVEEAAKTEKVTVSAKPEEKAVAAHQENVETAKTETKQDVMPAADAVKEESEVKKKDEHLEGSQTTEGGEAEHITQKPVADENEHDHEVGKKEEHEHEHDHHHGEKSGKEQEKHEHHHDHDHHSHGDHKHEMTSEKENSTSKMMVAGKPKEFQERGRLTSKAVQCMKLTEADIFGWGNEYLTERVKELRTPVVFLLISIVLLVLNIAQVYTSFTNPKQCNAFITNLIHLIMWGISAVCLMLFRFAWLHSWKTTSNFAPEYPDSYFYAELICVLMCFVFVLETYFYKYLHYNIYVEKGQGVYEILGPTYNCSVYHQDTIEGPITTV